jgi:hypothetical protein
MQKNRLTENKTNKFAILAEKPFQRTKIRRGHPIFGASPDIHR